MSLHDRIVADLAFWLLLTAVLSLIFGWGLCVIWQKSKLSMHEVRNRAGRPVYWVLNYGRIVIDVGTESRVRRRKRRMERTIEGRDVYEPAGVATPGWAGRPGHAEGAAGVTQLHQAPGTPGAGSQDGDRQPEHTEGNAP